MSPPAPLRGPVCHVNLASGFRGGERQTELLIRALAARGWPQRLVARRGAPLAGRLDGVAGVEVVPSSSQPLLAAVAARGSALLHAHEARSIYACWLAGRAGRRPWLLTRRVDNPFSDSPFRDRAYRAAGRVVGVSRAIRRLIEARYPGIACEVVPDAHADLARGHETPAALSARYRGRTVVGHIGALDHSHKGQLTIIEAARLAAQRFPELVFVLLGDGRDEERFRAAAAGLDNVEFTGFVNEVDDWLGVFDLFVYPSLHEGLGSALLDAMSFGLPIVATAVGGIPDVVDDGVNGLLIAPEQPEALLEAIRRILDDRGLYAAMREANLAKADDYSPGAMADRYESLYGAMLTEASAGVRG